MRADPVFADDDEVDLAVIDLNTADIFAAADSVRTNRFHISVLAGPQASDPRFDAEVGTDAHPASVLCHRW